MSEARVCLVEAAVAAHLAIRMPQKRPIVPQKLPNRLVELQAL